MTGDKRMSEFKCQRCGKCCWQYGGTLQYDQGDVIRWKDRPEIAQYLSPFIGLKDLWISPTTNEELAHCPFYRGRKRDGPRCAIYDLRPNVCRDYPFGRACLRKKEAEK